jgi:hypothetical protein
MRKPLSFPGKVLPALTVARRLAWSERENRIGRVSAPTVIGRNLFTCIQSIGDRRGDTLASERYINVFLDTEFFKGNSLDFNNKTFQALKTNVAAGHIHVVSTLITRREVERHVGLHAEELSKKLEQFRKDPVIRNSKEPAFAAWRNVLPQEKIQAELLAQLNAIWRELDIKTLPTDKVDTKAIFDDYFNTQPPFGPGKKKSEFPDAFAAHALRDWCASNSEKLHVVGRDGDWKALCESVPEFEHVTELAEILSRFPDPEIAKAVRAWLTANDADVRERISREAQQFQFIRWARQGTPIDYLNITKIRMDAKYVIQVEGGSATVEIPCLVRYEFKRPRTKAPDIHYLISLGDPGPSIYKKGKSRLVVELTVNYDPSTGAVTGLGDVRISKPLQDQADALF